jgi:hypothetical protein
MIRNLNHVSVTNWDGLEINTNEDFSTKMTLSDGLVLESVFKDLDKRLIQLIHEFKDGVIVGCVAWLTHEKILLELSNCKNVQIIVQKEDFLRPDINFGNNKTWWWELRMLYESLECEVLRCRFGGIMEHLSWADQQPVDPIRCVGNYNEAKLPVFPRSHHKFLVFCEKDAIETNLTNNTETVTHFSPKAIWTGSFNLTRNATMSLENAIILRDNSGENEIINSYLNVYRQVFSISEPLDWEHIWCEPEYRIGT